MKSAKKTYRDRQAYASFRGMSFLTESHEFQGGRRLAVHEYPGAEEPNSQDLGGKAREWQLTAYFIGDSYDLYCNSLLTLLNKPGADWLVHPWLGLLWVKPHHWSRRESNHENGFCSLTISFIAGGSEPSTKPDSVDKAKKKLQAVGLLAKAAFALKSFSSGINSFIATVQSKLGMVENLISMATLPLTWAQQLQTMVTGIQTDLQSLIALPSSYASALLNLTDTFGLGSLGAGVPSTQIPRLVRQVCALAAVSDSLYLSNTPITDPNLVGNLANESLLSSVLLTTCAAELALTDYVSSNDRDDALATVLDAIDLLLPHVGDDVFQALVDARSGLIEALMSQNLSPVVTKTIVNPLPATLLAYRLGVDETVFLAQNNVRHPLFVQGTVYA